MFLEQQEFWIDALSRRTPIAEEDTSEALLDLMVPEAARDFADPPGWTRRRTAIWLSNWFDTIREMHRSIESGRRPEPEPLNVLLAEGEITWGRDGRAQIALRSRDRALNRGTLFVRDLVLRTAYHFAQYAEYRISDPAWPDSSPDRFQVRECLCDGCGRLFARGPRRVLYCSDECAERHAAAGADGR